MYIEDLFPKPDPADFNTYEEFIISLIPSNYSNILFPVIK